MKYVLFFLTVVVLGACTSQNTTVASDEKKSDEAKVVVAEKMGVEVGDKAPDFKLKSIDGKVYSFANIKDGQGKAPKGYIVVFTCNTCPVAKANESRIIELQNKYAKMGYPVVAIQPNDPAAKPGDSYGEMVNYAEEKGFNFLYLFDEGQKIYPKYGATRTPEVFLVDKTLKVRYHGAIDDSARDVENVEVKFLENAIEALEKGEEPKPATTKAVGCSIKTV